jgi:hypothetical protein
LDHIRVFCGSFSFRCFKNKEIIDERGRGGEREYYDTPSYVTWLVYVCVTEQQKPHRSKREVFLAGIEEATAFGIGPKGNLGFR